MKKNIPHSMMKGFVNGLVVLAFVMAFSASGHSQESTEWQQGDYAQSRLIASHKAVPTGEEGPLYVGWHVKLAEGWKTYWRTPGDAGLAPQIDWDGSVNVADAEFLYPMPERFEIFDLFTYGYHDEVVYPIRITPAVEGAPITLKARVRFLVCEDLCVPMEATFEMTIPASDFGAPLSLNTGLIEKFLAQVPKSNDPVNAPIKISSFEILGSGAKKNLVFRVEGENILTGSDLIVEGINDLKFGIPKKRIAENPRQAEFIVPVFGIGPEVAMESTQVNVIVSDGWGNAQEFTLNLKN